MYYIGWYMEDLPFLIDRTEFAPLYEQIVNGVKRARVAGRLLPGHPFPSIRKIARVLKINPNTVAKAHDILIVEGVLEVRSKRRTYVAPNDKGLTERTRNRRLVKLIEKLLIEAELLGVTPDELAKRIAHRHAKMKAILPILKKTDW